VAPASRINRPATRRGWSVGSLGAGALKAGSGKERRLPMRKFILPVVTAAALLAPSLAMAAVQTTEGTIKSIDAKAMTITLNNNQAYHLPASYRVADLKAGEKVKVTWDKMGQLNEASKVEVEK
jgi:hypothetical protein